MRITFELPILARAVPKGSKSLVDVFCTTVLTADVQDVSSAETDVVFETARAFVRGATVPDPRNLVLRTFDGELYRKIADSLEDAEGRELFNKPFDALATGRLGGSTYHRLEWPADFGGDISPLREVAGNKPLARPLVDEYEWRLDRESAKVLKSKTAWPRPAPKGFDYKRGWHAHRNDVRFENTRLSDIVSADVDLAHTMMNTQADRLLLIDNEIWMKTRQPAYRVQFRPSYLRGSPSKIELSMVTAPEGYVGDLYTQHFSLADGERALEAARRIYGVDDAWGDLTRELLDFRVPFESADDLLAYDYQQEEINRFGYTAAVECRNYLARNPEHADKLREDELSGIREAFACVMEVNHVLGFHHDMADHIPILASAWKGLGYKQTLTNGVGVQHHATTAQERVLRYIEEAPISLTIPPPAVPTPGMR